MPIVKTILAGLLGLALLAAGCGGEPARVSSSGGGEPGSERPRERRSLPASATLVIVVDGSKRAHERSFRHALLLLEELAARPRMRLLVQYATNTIDDPGFDRPILAAQSPSPSEAPAYPEPPSCPEDEYERALCMEPYEAKLARVEQWWASLDAEVTRWQAEQVARLRRAAVNPRRLELPPAGRNLLHLFTRLGAVIRSSPRSSTCVAVFGGLLVRDPPALRGVLPPSTQVLSFGWLGRLEGQARWRRALWPAHVRFVPVELTPLDLVSSVRSCIEGRSS